MKKNFLLMTAFLTVFAMSSPGMVLALDSFSGVNIHGFVSQGFLSSGEYNYLTHDSKDGSFEYGEMGVNFSKSLTDKLRAGVQFFSRDIGNAANHKVTLDWAYGDYAFKNWLGVRFGKIKLPLGLYNETRDMDMLRTSIVMPQGIYNDLLRDNIIAMSGASIYGSVGMGIMGDLSYQLIEGTLNSDNDSGVGKYVESRYYGRGATTARAEEATEYKGATSLSLIWDTPAPGLRLGYSRFDVVTSTDIYLTSMVYPTPTGNVVVDVNMNQTGRSIFQIISGEFTWRDLVIAAEYMSRENEYEISPGAITYEHVVTESYYLSASYRFTDLFSLGFYYSEFFQDADDKDGDELAIDHAAWEKDFALTLRFDLNPYCVFKLEGHAVNGTANVLVIDNTDSDFDEEEWYYGAAKLTVSF